MSDTAESNEEMESIDDETMDQVKSEPGDSDDEAVESDVESAIDEENDAEEEESVEESMYGDAFISYVESDGTQTPFDFVKMLPDVDGFLDFKNNVIVESYADQEADEESAFNEEHSGFTITHLTPDLINTIGRPVVAKKGSAMDGWIVLHPAAAPKGSNKEVRATLEGREYNGVVLDPKTGTVDVFRYDVNKMNTTEAVRPNALHQRRHFEIFFQDKKLRDLAIKADNVRQASYELPFSNGKETEKVVIAIKMPYMPNNVFTLLKKEVKDESKKAFEAKKAAAVAKKEEANLKKAEAEAKKVVVAKAKKAATAGAAAKKLAIAEVKKAAANEVKTAKLSQKKISFKKEKAVAAAAETTLADDDDDDDNGDDMEMAAPEKALEALQRTLATMAPEAKKTAAAVRATPGVSKRKRHVPIHGGGGGGGGGSVKVKIVELPVVMPARKMRRTDEFNLENALSHMRVMASEGKTTQNYFRGKDTYGAIIKDEGSRGVFAAIYSFFEHYAPHVIGSGEPPMIPGSLPSVDEEFFGCGE